jgi:hypothetical protein
MERRVEQWMKDPSLDRDTRAHEARAFADQIIDIVMRVPTSPNGGLSDGV